jgi:magnesium-transporting ATPase (P-type)
VADVVLLENEYAAIPKALQIGSQVVVALQQVAAIFGVRVLYTTVLIVFGLLTHYSTNYPLEPRQLLLLNWITVGLPSLLWSLIPPQANFKLRSNAFFSQTARYAMPLGISGGLLAGISWIAAAKVAPDAIATSVSFCLLLVGLAAAWYAPQALGAIDSSEQRFFRYSSLILSIALIIGIMLSAKMRVLFGLALEPEPIAIGLIAGCISWAVTYAFATRLFPKSAYTL